MLLIKIMLALRCGCLSSLVVAPNVSAQRLADAEPDANGDADHEEDNQNFGDDFISAVEAVQAGASALLLSELGLLLPVLLAGPHLTLAPADLMGDLVGAGIRRLGRDHGLDVRVEGVASVRAWRR